MPDIKTKIYCFDSSAFIRINRFYPHDLFPGLWQELEVLIETGCLFSHEYAWNEIEPETKKPDFLGKWIKDKQKIFRKISERQTEIVVDILKKFPGLIDHKKEKDEADPWIIAVSKEEMEKGNLYEQRVIVVSEESIKSSTKIPAVCKEYGVLHFSLFEFFQDRGWKFKLEK